MSTKSPDRRTQVPWGRPIIQLHELDLISRDGRLGQHLRDGGERMPETRASCFWVYAYPAFLRYAAHSARRVLGEFRRRRRR